MPVPVPDQHIKNPGPDVGFFINFVFFVFTKFIQHIMGADQLIGIPKARLVAMAIRSAFFYHIQGISKFVIKSPNGLLFGHVVKLRIGMINSHRI